MQIRSPFGNHFGFAVKNARDLQCFLPYPEEKRLLEPGTIEKRCVHFLMGRAAAHQALRLIGHKPTPILQGPRHEPLWPGNIVGSITHTADVAIAAVAQKQWSDGIGIDLERLETDVSFAISRRICRARELAWVTEESHQSKLRLKTLFSAKEAVFKAFYPLREVYLHFQDVELTWQGNGFQGILYREAAEAYPVGYSFTVGAWRVEGFIFTFVNLPAQSPLEAIKIPAESDLVSAAV